MVEVGESIRHLRDLTINSSLLIVLGKEGKDNWFGLSIVESYFPPCTCVESNIMIPDSKNEWYQTPDLFGHILVVP